MTTDQKSPDKMLRLWDEVNFSDPPDQSDMAEALRRAIKERDEARAELAELNEWDIHALKERDDLREKLAIAEK